MACRTIFGGSRGAVERFPTSGEVRRDGEGERQNECRSRHDPPDTIRSNTVSESRESVAYMKGAEATRATNMAAIFGTNVSVISWICVRAWNKAMPRPTIVATARTGADAMRMAQIESA
jgi:hypothetical protein